MMKRLSLILLILLLLQSTTFAQSRKELEQRKKQTLEQLATTNKLLKETRKTQKSTINQINLLNRSIEQTNELITNLNDEITAINRDIDTLRIEKHGVETQLKRVQRRYAEMLRRSEIQRRHFSPILFILSSENLPQALRRFRYVREMSEYRKQQIANMKGLQSDLSAKEALLADNLNQKALAMTDKEHETQQMSRRKTEQNRMLNDLKRTEQKLKKQQQIQQKRADQLNTQIQQKIAEEIRRQEEAARKKAAAKTKESGKPTSGKKSPYVMSKEEQLVAGNFEKNKGHLPMPVAQGFISGHFGMQPHPVLQYVTQNNKGIYIQTPSGSDARAIYEGVVTQVFAVPGSNMAVIIKHGNYRTVYSNLTQVYVKTGDKVSTKQRIGKIFVDSENGNKTELYLMIYKDTAIQNPEAWIAR